MNIQKIKKIYLCDISIVLYKSSKLNSCEREYSFLISDHEDRLKIMRSVSIAAAYSMLPLIFRGLMFGNLSQMRP